MANSVESSRRKFIAGLSAISLGSLSGCSDGISEISEDTSGIGDSPEPGEKVREVNPSNSFFTKISLYDNGVAEITLQEDHGDFERIGFTHAIHDLEPGQAESDAYAIWEAPEFADPITVDLKGPIQEHGPYPSPNFKLRLLAEEGSTIFYTGPTKITVEFKVPDSYLPE